jgi:16S rRNA G527 N7-methylase RsmG
VSRWIGVLETNTITMINLKYSFYRSREAANAYLKLFQTANRNYNLVLKEEEIKLGSRNNGRNREGKAN